MTKSEIYTLTRLPIILLNLLFCKIFGLIFNMKYEYMHLAAKINIGISMGMSYKIKTNPKKVNLSHITNKKMQRTLMFGKWNIYSIRINSEKNSNKTDSNREVIYITKDNIKKDDLIYVSRISDYKLNKKYTSNAKFNRFLDKQNLKTLEFYKLESQLYCIVAIKTILHDKLKEEQKIYYEKKVIKDFNKKVKKLIKDENLFGKYKVMSDWSNMPLFFKCIKANRIDLVKKF